MTRDISFSSIVLALSVAVIIGPAVTGAVAQEEPLCDETRTTHPIPTPIGPNDVVWEELYEIGSGSERVAIVVWHDPAGDPPDGLYSLLQEGEANSIDTYAADVAAAGFTVAVVKFYGMAEDPVDPDAEDLRWQLAQMFEQPESLAGAVLVGNVQYLLYEYDKNPLPEVLDLVEFASDALLGDMDGEIYDIQQEEPWRPLVFDEWDAPLNDDMEIWTSRIMARPELVDYFGETQQQILTTYFDHNHNDRWSAFNSTGEALLYGCFSCCWDGLSALQDLFGESNVVHVCPETGTPGPEDYRTHLSYGYAHVHLHACHGTAISHFYSAVLREHYTDEVLYPDSADPQTMSFVFEPCSNCDFAISNPNLAPSIGEVVAFNPEAPTLVVFGPSKDMGGFCLHNYYSVLPEGRCLGEGLKVVINNHVSYDINKNGYMLLGDGTLKRWGETVEWTGESPAPPPYDNKWDDPDNWSIGDLPMPTDNVLHDNEDVIQMNTGTDETPNRIMGFEGDGEQGGSLWILLEKVLELGGDAVFSNGYDVTLQATPIEHLKTKLTVMGRIFGGNFTLNDRCDLQVGAGFAAPGSELYGTWVLDGPGANAWFANAGGSTQTPLWLTLKNGAQVEIEEMAYDCPPDCGTFPDTPEHELVYGAGANQLGGGLGSGLLTDQMYFGDYTRIRALTQESALNLDLRSELHIASDFVHAFVYQGWDTRGVDITAQPIWADQPDAEQATELISPDFEPWFVGVPVIFLDVPCHGAFGHLAVPGLSGGDLPLQTWAANGYNNSIIDEDDASGWPFNTRDTDGPAEAGFFKDVTVGVGRTLGFREEEGVVYFHGERTIDGDATILYWYEEDEEPTELGAKDYDYVMVPAAGTHFGDWDGDCEIRSRECLALAYIVGISEDYNPLYDSNCDGYISHGPDLSKCLDNYANHQPPPDCDDGLDGGGGGGGGEDEAPAEEPECLAAYLLEHWTEDELQAFIADLIDAAEEYAGTALGDDMEALLSCLE